MSNEPKDWPGPYAVGSDVWPGLGKLAEECAEVVQVAAKIIGAGGSVEHWDQEKGDPRDLRERLVSELGDVLGTIAFFAEQNDIPDEKLAELAAKKYEQVLGWHRKGRVLQMGLREATSLLREDFLDQISRLSLDEVRALRVVLEEQ